jgi:hypothetical protein
MKGTQTEDNVLRDSGSRHVCVTRIGEVRKRLELELKKAWFTIIARGQVIPFLGGFVFAYFF